VLAHSGAQAIICDDQDPSPLLFYGLDVKLAVSIDAIKPDFVAYSELLDGSPDPLFAKANPTLILYTSGTTGLPKGVASATRAGPQRDPRTAEYLGDVASTRRIEPGSVVLLTLPVHHGVGPAILWDAIQAGSRIVLMRRFDPEGALELIQSHKVTHWTGVPTMYKRIAALPREKLGVYDVSSIKALSIGAAPVPFSLKKWIIDYFGPNRLAEAYGATEVGMVSFLAPEMQAEKPGSSGLPHKHVDISVREENGNELPAGQAGEIWIRTPITIRRYLNAEPLGPDTLDADGFFRVGDVGMVDEDGYLFITDRATDMIISGGVNIYPAEIEAAILQHPAIQDVAVIGIPDEEFGEQVKAFCELKPGRHIDEDGLIVHCGENLASYKIPRTVEFMRELPRNTMGKVLKRELREPYWKGRERNV